MPEPTLSDQTSIRVSMVDVEGQLLREIGDPRIKRDDVKLTYAFGIRDCPNEVDWAKVNGAILDRWSMNALKYIKKGAWALLEGSRMMTSEQSNTSPIGGSEAPGVRGSEGTRDDNLRSPTTRTPQGRWARSHQVAAFVRPETKRRLAVIATEQNIGIGRVAGRLLDALMMSDDGNSS